LSRLPLNCRYFFVHKFIEVTYYGPLPKENPGSAPAHRKLSFPPTPPNKCTHFPITNIMRKQWASHIAERPLPRAFGGHVIIYGRVIGLSTNLNKTTVFKF